MISKLTCQAYLTEIVWPQIRDDRPGPPLSVCLDLMFPMTVDIQGEWSTLERLMDSNPVRITIERIEQEKK